MAEPEDERWGRQKRLAVVTLVASLALLGCLVGGLFLLAGGR